MYLTNNISERVILSHGLSSTINFVQDKPNHRWISQQSDMDSDYRRDLATKANGVSAHHQEARARDGGGGSGYESNGRPIKYNNQQKSMLKPRSLDRSQYTQRRRESSPLGGGQGGLHQRSSSSAREEERRKVLEIERRYA